MIALAGDDQHPAVAGYDPDVGGELYTTNGEITDTMYLELRRPGLHGRARRRLRLGRRRHDDTTPNGMNPGGFVFQDREADVEAVFQKNLPFFMDLAQSASHPDNPTSHLGNVAPDFVPVTFPTSYGNPQTVEVNVKRSLGTIVANYQVGSGPVQQAATSEFNGGDRYGKSGVIYHRMRASLTGFKPGDQVKVWFTGGGKASDPFTFTASTQGHNAQVSCSRPRTTWGSAQHRADRRPSYLSTYLDALADDGIRRRLRHRRAGPHAGRRARRAQPLQDGHLVHGPGRLRPRSRPDPRRLEDVRRPDGLRP